MRRASESLARSSESTVALAWQCDTCAPAVHGPGTATGSLCTRRAESTRQTPSPGLAVGSSPPAARGHRGCQSTRDGRDFQSTQVSELINVPWAPAPACNNGILLSVYAHYRSVVESRVPCGMPHSATSRMTRPPLQGSQSSCMLICRLGLRIFLADSVACSMLHAACR
jgi:hypothetical protein